MYVYIYIYMYICGLRFLPVAEILHTVALEKPFLNLAQLVP